MTEHVHIVIVQLSQSDKVNHTTEKAEQIQRREVEVMVVEVERSRRAQFVCSMAHQTLHNILVCVLQ